MVVRPSLSPGGAGALSLAGLLGGPLLLPSGGVGAPPSRVALLPRAAARAPLPPVRPFLLPDCKNKAIPRDETKQRREELVATLSHPEISNFRM
jgi:hypothetical protein